MARWLIFPLLIKELRSIKYLFQDKQAKKRYKAVVIFGLIYLFWPIDLIPAPIIGLSLIDDIVLWGFILSYLKEPLSKYDDRVNEKKRKKTYQGKNVVDDVNYTIKEEGEEE